MGYGPESDRWAVRESTVAVARSHTRESFQRISGIQRGEKTCDKVWLCLLSVLCLTTFNSTGMWYKK
jgi:hypothetical protein